MHIALVFLVSGEIIGVCEIDSDEKVDRRDIHASQMAYYFIKAVVRILVDHFRQILCFFLK